MDEITKLKQRIELLERLVGSFARPDIFIFTKDIEFRNGAKIGISATTKLGFYGQTPIAQPSDISAPSGGSTIDTQARTAINTIITDLANLGLTGT